MANFRSAISNDLVQNIYHQQAADLQYPLTAFVSTWEARTVGVEGNTAPLYDFVNSLSKRELYHLGAKLRKYQRDISRRNKVYQLRFRQFLRDQYFEFLDHDAVECSEQFSFEE